MPKRQNIPIYQIFDLFGKYIISSGDGLVNRLCDICPYLSVAYITQTDNKKAVAARQPLFIYASL